MIQPQAVAFDGVSRRFGATLALDDVGFDIAVGETVSLLGPNGAGKSTAISVMLGLLDPSDGRARTPGLSEGTVRNHLSAAIQKTGARNRADAARIASAKGWLAPETET
jgi:ABC-2 type transport system ATP-binding protein